jgi:hypothetical protein
MRPDEVPEQSAPLLEGQRKAVYVVDQDGHYLIAQSGGTEAEITVTEQAVAWFAKLAEDARQRARLGETSPMEYHMFRLRMDVPTLAQATGLWRWRVRRHLTAKSFARLSPILLARYAEALGLTTTQLRSLD